MSHKPFMPLYISEYLADTAHFSTLEHGAYLLLIMNYWETEKPLPNDDKKLAAITRLSVATFKKIRAQLISKFTASDQNLVHKRVDKELAIFRKKSELARVSASKRWDRTSKNSDANAMRSHYERNANAMRTQCYTDTDTDTELSCVSETEVHSLSPQDQSFFDNSSRNLKTVDQPGLEGAKRKKLRSTPKKPRAPSAEPDVVRSAPPQPVITSPVFIFIPARGEEEFGVTEEVLREFEISYPHLDVKQKLQRIRMWSLSNPSKRKTLRGMLRFINQWIAKDNDRLDIGTENRKLSVVEHNQLLLEQRKAKYLLEEKQ